MKMIITEKDLPSLYGKFIVQLNADQDEPCMAHKFREHPGFWLEKRISFVGRWYGSDGWPAFNHKDVPENESLIILNGLYYCHGIYPISEFIPYWNHYQFGEDKEKWDKHRDQRYHRLLTHKELDWLNEELKKT